MAKKRTTFGKLQRERDKQQKQMAKRDRRINRDDDVVDDDADAPTAQYDEAQTLAALAALHEAFDDGRISLDDFEAQRDELRQRLVT
jgi:hypothetical protein